MLTRAFINNVQNRKACIFPNTVLGTVNQPTKAGYDRMFGMPEFSFQRPQKTIDPASITCYSVLIFVLFSSNHNTRLSLISRVVMGQGSAFNVTSDT